MNISNLSFNWFDLAVVAIIGLGVYRGRNRGMSEELLDVLKWLAIVGVGGLVYRPVGQWLADYVHLSLSNCYVLTYLLTIVLFRLFFGWIKRMVGEKLLGSDFFGSGEYYLGMIAGAVRFSCYLLVAFAILNSQYVSPEQLAANARMQQDNFGDISFPTIGTIQQTAFGSASGQLIKQYLAHELIVTAAADRSAPPTETLGRQRERVLSEVLGEKK